MNFTLIRAILITTFVGLLPAPCRAESVVIQWEKVYKGPGNGRDEPVAVAVDSAGNAIITGSSYNVDGRWGYYTAKYAAADGALLWEKRYDPPDPGNGVSASPVDLAVDGADNVIVTGSYSTFKYSAANGEILWEKHYTGNPAALALDSADNVIVTGIAGGYYTVKYAAANGAVLWEKRYNGPGPVTIQDVARDVAVDSGGNAIVTGYSGTPGVYDYYTAKYAAADGALLWEKRYDGPGDVSQPFHVVVDSQGNAIVTGFSRNNDGKYEDYTAKYAAADGALLWEQHGTRPDGSSGDGHVALDHSDNVVMASGRNGDPYAAKYAAADGAILWEKRQDEAGFGYGFVALDDAGNVVVTGRSISGEIDDLYTAKFAAVDGALLWEKRYKGPGGFGFGIAVDGSGGIVVLGGISGGTNYYTVKYVPADADKDGLLDSWEIAYLGSTDAHSALDDNDGDGAVELLELAFGTDPLKPDVSAGPAVVVEGGYLTTTIAKQPGVAYFVQTSATPGGGFSAASTTLLTDTATTLKVRDNVLTGTQPARFLRVQVTAAP